VHIAGRYLLITIASLPYSLPACSIFVNILSEEMAPTITTGPATAVASATVIPQPKDWNGDEFSNNLFSDLAPLLTLFGEQVRYSFLLSHLK
jgi:hypothetical protein